MKKRFKFMDCIPLISNTTKIKISICLLIFAFIMCIIYPEALDRKICLIAMFLSFLGDIALNCVLVEKRPHLLTYIGAAFFMFAHLTYASAYYNLISNSYKYFNPGMVIAFSLIILLSCVTIIRAITTKQSLQIPMLLVFGIYMIIISINFLTICSYSWSAKSLSSMGALSFLISDFIIGVETIFKIKNDILRKLVWIFYPIGQIFIIACR